jgi:hypothetical protein
MPYTTRTSGNGQVKMLDDNSLVKCKFITHNGSLDGDTGENVARIMDQQCFYNDILYCVEFPIGSDKTRYTKESLITTLMDPVPE